MQKQCVFCGAESNNEVNRNSNLSFSSHINTLRLHYKDQAVNAVRQIVAVYCDQRVKHCTHCTVCEQCAVFGVEWYCSRLK
jgi:hypothetical protein